MTGILITYDGRRFALPVLLEWKMQYTCGTPCDSFEVLCPWGEEVAQALGEATRFEAAQDGQRVFTGVVDEYQCRWSEEGARLFLAGRGMGALLLDNEAMPEDYLVATEEDILRRHVQPYGLEVVGRARCAGVPSFSVESGSSEWKVLRDFYGWQDGVEPHFDREGRLVLEGWNEKRRLVIDEETPLAELTYRERRYGVVSEVVVLDRARRTSQRVADQSLLDEGYRCRRVVCTAGRSTAGEMRRNGAFQLKEAAKERLELTVTLMGAFAVWPGDLLEWKRGKPELGGAWRVRECESGAGYTRVRAVKEKR